MANSSRSSIFLSYSHKDERLKAQIVEQLSAVSAGRQFDVWSDSQIAAGDDWFPKIEDAINRAAVAILVVSASFLNSPFILREEVPRLLTKRETEGLRVIPVIGRSCPWTTVDWISKILARPKDGKSLMGLSSARREAALAELATEIGNLIRISEAEQSESQDNSRSSDAIDRKQIIRGAMLKIGENGVVLLVRLHADGTLIESRLSDTSDSWSGTWDYDGDRMKIEVNTHTLYSLMFSVRRDRSIWKGIESYRDDQGSLRSHKFLVVHLQDFKDGEVSDLTQYW